MLTLLVALSCLAHANEAVREYEYAHRRWVTSSLRSFIYRDLTGNSWESGASLADFDEWDHANPFEREIEAAAERMIRLELDVCEQHGLCPHHVWQPITYANGTDEPRLGPRHPPFDRAYVADVIARVEAISPNYAAIMKRWVLQDWEDRESWQEPGESVREWRHRFWAKSQLYDLESPEEEGKSSWFVRLMRGRDPTARLVAMESVLAQRYDLSDEQLWEALEHIVHSWKEDAWSVLHRPRRYPPPVEGFERDVVRSVGKIHGLAGRRLTSQIEHHRGVLQKYRLEERIATSAAEAAQAALDADPRRRELPDYFRERFDERLATIRGRQNAYLPGEIDPTVAEELGRRLLDARARGLAKCNSALTRQP